MNDLGHPKQKLYRSAGHKLNPQSNDDGDFNARQEHIWEPLLGGNLYFYNPITAFLSSLFMREFPTSSISLKLQKQIRSREMAKTWWWFEKNAAQLTSKDYSMTLSRATNLSNEYWINEWTLKYLLNF